MESQRAYEQLQAQLDEARAEVAREKEMITLKRRERDVCHCLLLFG